MKWVQLYHTIELWCWRRFLRVPWTARRSNQFILKEISPEYSLEGLMLKAEALILCPCVSEELTHLKWPWCWEDWRQEEKGTTEDEMVGQYHWLKGHEFEQAPGVGDRQGSLACYSSWGRKELDISEWLNWTELYHTLNILWYCSSLGLQWKLTFSSPVDIAEISKFSGILNAAL